jgi:DNA invertase Pin-like site-specific DNA recombinase
MTIEPRRSGALVAYCRVSSTDQNLDTQLVAVNAAGATKVFREKESGANEARPQLRACLDYLREGDELVVTRADRIARSSHHLLSILNDLGKRGVNVRFLDQPQLNTGDRYGKFMLTVLAGVAELERELIRERANEGIKQAKKRGVKFGRPKLLTDEVVAEIKTLRAGGIGVAEIMRRVGLGRATVFKALASQSSTVNP